MQFLATLLLLAARVFGFLIPENQADGVYGVTYGDNDTETHTLLMSRHEYEKRNVNLNLRGEFNGSPSRDVMRKRQVPNANEYIGCGGYRLDVGDTDRANGMLDAQCMPPNNWVKPNMDFYSISGMVVSYFCNFSYKMNMLHWYRPVATQCWAADRQALAHEINEICGAYIAGWDRFNSVLTDGYRGQYGWEARDNQYCGRGIDG